MKLNPIFYYIVLLFACLGPAFSYAQQAPFQAEIDAFKKEDSAHFPPKNSILFAGSSSFRMWSDVQNYFPGYTIVNRAFGGSSLPDVIHFANDILLPYKPQQVVIYCGENDFAASDTVTANTVFDRFKTLYGIIRTNLGKKVSVVFVSIKPSPSRERLIPKMVEANTLISNYLQTQKNTAFVDVYHLMLTADGKLRPELFKEDMLHMKPEGYAIWQKAIQPYLRK